MKTIEVSIMGLIALGALLVSILSWRQKISQELETRLRSIEEKLDTRLNMLSEEVARIAERQELLRDMLPTLVRDVMREIR